ncbi:MAG: LacI family DNA-binding transcriptional regulator [Gammaproteobacteria bacterium]
MSKKATIKDVASDAMVSIKTVSRVINNEQSVAKKTRVLVLKSIEKLSFTPNKDAQGLRSKKSFLIGLLYDNPNKYYLSDVQSGSLKACSSTNYNLAFLECKNNFTGLLNNVDTFIKNTNLNGIILTPPLSDNLKLIKFIESLGIPISFIAPPSNSFEIWSAATDSEAAYDISNKIISMGHTKIAFIRGHKDHSASKARFNGFTKSLAENNIKLNPELVLQGNFSFDSGYKLAAKLLTKKNKPTAIFCSNDSMAAGVIKYCYQKGIAIPKDLSVTGFDDSMIAQEIWPSLTTVRQPVEQMAKHATSALIAKISGTNYATKLCKTFKSEVVLRESLGIAPK